MSARLALLSTAIVLILWSSVAPLAAQPSPTIPVRPMPDLANASVGPQYRVAFSSSGGWLVTDGRQVVSSGLADMERKVRQFIAAGHPIDVVAVAPDGRGFVVVSGDQAHVEGMSEHFDNRIKATGWIVSSSSSAYSISTPVR